MVGVLFAGSTLVTLRWRSISACDTCEIDSHPGKRRTGPLRDASSHQQSWM